MYGTDQNLPPHLPQIRKWCLLKRLPSRFWILDKPRLPDRPMEAATFNGPRNEIPTSAPQTSKWSSSQKAWSSRHQERRYLEVCSLDQENRLDIRIEMRVFVFIVRMAWVLSMPVEWPLAQKSLPNKQKVLKLSLSPEQWECTIVDHSLQHITTHRYRRLWDLPEVRWRGFSASISAAARSNRSHPPQSCPEMWKAGLFDHTTQMGVGREEMRIMGGECLSSQLKAWKWSSTEERSF